MNKMVFPAGILQTPFFDREVGMEANYGGIGMVMGHELTHGFDDEGRRYDAHGNLVEWWTPKVGKDFEAKAECVAKEYDAFESLPGLHLNGKLTLGENIADHGGLRLAYDAWKRESGESKAKKNQSKSQFKSKFNEEQRFFLGFAQSWCSKKKEQLARMHVKTDPHSPPRFRVNGTVSQFVEFSTAFQCKPGTPMAPVNRCSVW
jgi:predicted metalloendopeptidase